jgi:hypothetical protein
MRRIFATAGIALVAVVLVKLDAAEAAVISVGTPDGPFGSDKCMEVKGNDDKPGTAVIVERCEAGPDQRFDFGGPDSRFVGKVPSGQTIYAEGGKRCLEVTNNSNVPGALVRIDDCKFDPGSLPGQQFYYKGGQIVYAKKPSLCFDKKRERDGLDHVVINICDPTSDTQQWQIK